MVLAVGCTVWPPPPQGLSRIINFYTLFTLSDSPFWIEHPLPLPHFRASVRPQDSVFFRVLLVLLPPCLPEELRMIRTSGQRVPSLFISKLFVPEELQFLVRLTRKKERERRFPLRAVSDWFLEFAGAPKKG